MNYDLINYDAPVSIDDDYFEYISDLFRDNDVELMNAVLALEENLPIKNYTLEEVIGNDDEFSHYIESLIDDAHVTYEKAFAIKQQIREEYEAGMILNESLLIRLAYLFGEKSEPSITSHDMTCPYCGMPIDDHDRYCHFCGVNLAFDPDELEDNLLKSVSSEKSGFREDIRFVAFKFLSLIRENIEVEYSIFTIENTYHIEWAVLRSFLEDNHYFHQDIITNEGYEFLDTHPLHFWQKYHMDIVDYSDFENYYYEHYPKMNPTDICLNYLKQFGDDEYVLEIIDEINHDL